MLKCHKNLKNGIFIIVRQPQDAEKDVETLKSVLKRK